MKLPKHLSAKERKAIQRAVHRLAAEFPEQVRFVALFGSKARGDFGPESDIDLLIISEKDDWHTRHKIRNPVIDVNLDYSLYISPRVIGWERFQNLQVLRPGFLKNLRHEALELWRRPGTENPLKSSEISPPVVVAA
ncbi:MAG: nucleotidyltransferase domain-containing protein [Chloroflexi bacterium]|nr:nucleotidyltransferase domain-containing protein [Chloroflexota bacterium]MBI4314338.1 nucleotidyltransferase domain-containing protein [Chloroflexota bacterium]MBI5290549.1 nucleotidyltransferase domain-containing protein [Chloroflexota bacterium]